MHRLQAVADVGQRAPDDDAHRIVEIRLAHLVFEIDVQNFARDFSHESWTDTIGCTATGEAHLAVGRIR